LRRHNHGFDISCLGYIRRLRQRLAAHLGDLLGYRARTLPYHVSDDYGSSLRGKTVCQNPS
jgi:hypothetical protein